MKNKVKLILVAIVSMATVVLLTSSKTLQIEANALIGAWGFGPPEKRTVMITTDKIFSVATYDVPGKKFISSYGGTWRVDGNKLIKKIEWNSMDTSEVGKDIIDDIQITDGKLVNKSTSTTWTRLDDGTPGKLMGAWIITGTYADNKLSRRPSPFFPRRTMKVLSGKHFQWIAYNVTTKAFLNAGGGTYTTDNGKYTENIEFFTKTPESVGKGLTFNYSLVDGGWRHSGEKSTGGPMDEFWSKRETLESQ